MGTAKKKGMVYTVNILLVVFILFSLGAAVSLGQVEIPLKDTFRILLFKLFGMSDGGIKELAESSLGNIIWQIRLPRAILSLLIGSGLAMCGVIMQACVQNPLADPYILGISSGGSLGATFAILIGFQLPDFLTGAGTAFWAFLGAFGASLFVLTLAGVGGKMTSTKLVLAGMVVNALFSAFSNFIIYFANNAEGIKSVTFWTMGSLAAANWEKLPLIAACVGLPALFFLFQARVLNTMLLGDDTAVTLGISLHKYRKIYLFLTSLITGVMVAGCGTIGFVGLIIPHLVRGFTGSDHKLLLPTSLLVGSAFMIWADVIARIVIPGSEVPIGIITAMVGAPLFMYMLMKKNYGFGSR